MLSVVITICTAVLLIAGIGYAVYEYFPYVVNMVNSVSETVSALTSALPSWLIPLATVGIAVAIIGIIVKLL